jgi:hypothetical protein
MLGSRRHARPPNPVCHVVMSSFPQCLFRHFLSPGPCQLCSVHWPHEPQLPLPRVLLFWFIHTFRRCSIRVRNQCLEHDHAFAQILASSPRSLSFFQSRIETDHSFLQSKAFDGCDCEPKRRHGCRHGVQEARSATTNAFCCCRRRRSPRSSNDAYKCRRGPDKTNPTPKRFCLLGRHRAGRPRQTWSTETRKQRLHD